MWRYKIMVVLTVLLSVVLAARDSAGGMLGKENRQVLFLIDDSSSMEAQGFDAEDPSATRWELLQKACPEWMSRLDDHTLVGALSVGGECKGKPAIEMPVGGGTVEVHATAECFSPLAKLEVIVNGQLATGEEAPKGARAMSIKQNIRIRGSGWIAARCTARADLPGAYLAAHTSPIYVKCGETRAFDGPAAEHMLALVEGGIEYLNTVSTAFDASARRRMTRLFKEAREELKGRLVVEAHHTHHHQDGAYHTHGHGAAADHKH